MSKFKIPGISSKYDSYSFALGVAVVLIMQWVGRYIRTHQNG